MGREMVLQLAMDGEGDTMTIEERQEAIRDGLGTKLEWVRGLVEEGKWDEAADIIPAFLTEKGAVLPYELCSRYTTCIHYPLMEKK